MPCPVCVHAAKAAIEANSARLSLRQLEARYQVSRSSLQRHQQRCQHPAQGAGDPGEPVPPSTTPACASNPLATYHAEAQQLSHALTSSTTPPPAPAYLVNAQVHQAMRRLYTDLPTSQPYLHDPRQAVAKVVELLLTLVKDDTGA